MNSKVKEIVDWMFGSDDEIAASPSLEKMAEYADSVCVRNAQDEDFARSQCSGLLDHSKYHLWNGTSLGNLAYMALYGHPKYRGKYLKGLRQYAEATGSFDASLLNSHGD